MSGRHPLVVAPAVALAAALAAALAPTAATQGILDPFGFPDPSYPTFYAWLDTTVGLNGSSGPLPDDTPVATWHDRTGRGHDLTVFAGDRLQRPTYRTGIANGSGAVVFDGDDWLVGDSAGRFGTLSGPKTVFLVTRVRAADGGYVFDGTDAQSRNALFTGQSATPGQWHTYTGNGAAGVGPAVERGTFQLHTVRFEATQSTHWLNGTALQTTATPLAPLAGLTLGARYTRAHELVGDIAEVLIYATALTTAERRSIEGYLLGRYRPRPAPWRPDPIDVFVAGDGRYHTYRIPAVWTTTGRTVLAFAEGRASRSDHAANDIVLRRSRDLGASWSPVQVLYDAGGDSLNNPCVTQIVAGPNTGRVLLMFQRFPQGCHTGCVVSGYVGTNVQRSYLMHSDDDGATWSTPLDITRQVRRPTRARAVASGPGNGIQKRRAPHAGRIVFPFNQIDTAGRWDVYSCYSDDGGTTWTRGAIADPSQTPGNGNEVQIFERHDGAIVLNSRSNGGTRHRKVAISTDGGASWSALRDDPQLNEPQVMASVFHFTDPIDGYAQSRVLFVGPNSRRSRTDGTVHLSRDGGTTWTASRLLHPNFFAYSTLTNLDGRRAGCLFERDGYGKISFSRFSVEWLTDGDDCLNNHAASYGVGCAGTGGAIPALSATGCPTSEQTITLRIANSAPAAVAFLAIGLRRASLPVPPCRILTTPLLATVGPVSLSGSGDGAVALPIPRLTDLATMTFQALVLDAASPIGVAASAGLEVAVF